MVMGMKKLFAGVLSVILGIGISAGAVMAAPSASAQPSVVNTDNGSDRYIVSDYRSSANYRAMNSSTPTLVTALEKVNTEIASGGSSSGSSASASTELKNTLQEISNDTSLPQTVRDSAAQMLTQVEDKKQPVTNFFDLDKTGENVRKTSDGKYQVTLKIPSLTTSTAGIVILHYSVERQTWEIITPSDIDLANQEITAAFDDLGPVMILADTNAANTIATMTADGTSSSAKSPKTEDTTGRWIGFAAAALVLAGAAAVAFRRKRA